MENLFDFSHQYDEMLQRGIRLSGETKDFFIRGRVQDLKSQLPPEFVPRRVLDFGCGIGSATQALAEAFPKAQIIGLDSSENALDHARKIAASPRVQFIAMENFSEQGSFDLCYVNGVFHHIEIKNQPAAMSRIHQLLGKGGFLAFFENNPWNPGTRLVMRRIPFDRDATPLSAPSARKLLLQANFSRLYPTRFLFYFPRPLAILRPLEPCLIRVPLGAQYHILASK